MRGGDQKIMWFKRIVSVAVVGMRVVVPGSTCIRGRVPVVAGGGGIGRVVLSSCLACSAGMDAAGSCRRGRGHDYRSSRAAHNPASSHTILRGSCCCPDNHVGC